MFSPARFFVLISAFSVTESFASKNNDVPHPLYGGAVQLKERLQPPRAAKGMNTDSQGSNSETTKVLGRTKVRKLREKNTSNDSSIVKPPKKRHKPSTTSSADTSAVDEEPIDVESISAVDALPVNKENTSAVDKTLTEVEENNASDEEVVDVGNSSHPQAYEAPSPQMFSAPIIFDFTTKRPSQITSVMLNAKPSVSLNDRMVRIQVSKGRYQITRETEHIELYLQRGAEYPREFNSLISSEWAYHKDDLIFFLIKGDADEKLPLENVNEVIQKFKIRNPDQKKVLRGFLSLCSPAFIAFIYSK